jgi:hypothetical protein
LTKAGCIIAEVTTDELESDSLSDSKNKGSYSFTEWFRKYLILSNKAKEIIYTRKSCYHNAADITSKIR